MLNQKEVIKEKLLGLYVDVANNKEGSKEKFIEFTKAIETIQNITGESVINNSILISAKTNFDGEKLLSDNLWHSLKVSREEKDDNGNIYVDKLIVGIKERHVQISKSNGQILDIKLGDIMSEELEEYLKYGFMCFDNLELGELTEEYEIGEKEYY